MLNRANLASPGAEPNRRYWLLGAVFAGSLLFLLFQGGKLAFMLFVIVFVLSGYLLLGKWSGITRTTGRRTLAAGAGEALEAGAVLKIRVDLHIPGFWPVPYVLVRDRLIRKNGGEYLFEASLIPDWARKGSLEYTTPPLSRGFYQFGRTDCSTQDIFGIFEHKGVLDLPASFAVMPQTVVIKEWKQLQRVFKGAHHHSATVRAHRETTQINGVREYNYGDRLSRIHWNATARTGMLKSKEFEREALPKTVIVVDRKQRNYASREQFELAVSVAASLLTYGKNREIAFGLLSVGSDSTYFEPGDTDNRHRAIMNHLIGVEADGHHPLRRVLEDRARNFAPGTCMVVVSPMRGEAALKPLAWIKQRQMIACHMWIAGGKDDGKAWVKQLAALGYLGYEIRSLEELPAALGGRADE